MSVAFHPTRFLPAPQPPDPDLVFLDHRWEAEVLPLLPPGCAHQAYALGAFQRVRGLAHPAVLLRALLAYILCAPSFRFLGAWALLLNLADLSDTAWRKRFVTASLWLDWLLQQLLAAPPSAPPVPGPRILLGDSTVLRHPAQPQRDWRIHTCFNLTAAALATVRLTDTATAESTRLFGLQPGDIGVFDAGFGRRSQVVPLVQDEVRVVVRVHPRLFPCEDAAGAPVAVVAWLRSQGGYQREREVYVRWQGARVRVRLVAKRLSASATAKAQRRKRRKACTDRRQITEETLFLAGWVLVVTTLEAGTWPRDAVLRLYRARWQIELLFKRMKQVGGLAVRGIRNRARAEAVLRAALVAWALQAVRAGELREWLGAVAARARGVVSAWGVTQWAGAAVRAAVAGGWTWARVEACVERLGRFLCSKRRRRQQEARVREWLQRRAAAQGQRAPTLGAEAA